MNQIKAAVLYILALIVLLAPAIILGWIGLSLLSWPGLLVGVLAGLALFAYSVNKIAAQEDAENEDETETGGETETKSETEPAPSPEEQRQL
jgi:hypothetical protein